MWQEFKPFALKGNMVESAIGVVVGSAGANIISSIVKGMLVPHYEWWLGDRPHAASDAVPALELVRLSGTLSAPR